MNVTMNWTFVNLEFKFNPKNIGNQWIIAPIIANTAPIDNT